MSRQSARRVCEQPAAEASQLCQVGQWADGASARLSCSQKRAEQHKRTGTAAHTHTHTTHTHQQHQHPHRQGRKSQCRSTPPSSSSPRPCTACRLATTARWGRWRAHSNWLHLAWSTPTAAPKPMNRVRRRSALIRLVLLSDHCTLPAASLAGPASKSFLRLRSVLSLCALSNTSFTRAASEPIACPISMRAGAS